MDAPLLSIHEEEAAGPAGALEVEGPRLRHQVGGEPAAGGNLSMVLPSPALLGKHLPSEVRAGQEEEGGAADPLLEDGP